VKQTFLNNHIKYKQSVMFPKTACTILLKSVQYGLQPQQSLLRNGQQCMLACRKHFCIESPPTGSSQERQPFSGEIPPDSLEVNYSRSGGPGGQHANKVATKVEVRFNVQQASWIPDWIKPRLMEREANRITKNGDFVITSSKTRKQLLNQADALNRLRTIIYDASKLPKEKSPEELELEETRRAKRAASILKEKRNISYTKSNRGAL